MIEVWVWTFATAAGFLLAVVLLVKSIYDLTALGGVRNGRRIHVWGRLASESIRAIVHASFFFLGVTALLEIDLGPWAIRILVAGTVLLIGNSVIALLIRRWTEVSPPIPLTALEVADLAATVAQRLTVTAERAAGAVLAVAEEAKRELDRVALANAVNSEQVVKATRETADNTRELLDRQDTGK